MYDRSTCNVLPEVGFLCDAFFFSLLAPSTHLRLLVRRSLSSRVSRGVVSHSHYLHIPIIEPQQREVLQFSGYSRECLAVDRADLASKSSSSASSRLT